LDEVGWFGRVNKFQIPEAFQRKKYSSALIAVAVVVVVLVVVVIIK
jgi:hypothetical protein